MIMWNLFNIFKNNKKLNDNNKIDEYEIVDMKRFFKVPSYTTINYIQERSDDILDFNDAYIEFIGHDPRAFPAKEYLRERSNGSFEAFMNIYECSDYEDGSARKCVEALDCIWASLGYDDYFGYQLRIRSVTGYVKDVLFGYKLKRKIRV